MLLLLQGLAEVLAELERSHLEYPHSTHQPILYAASPAKQRVYALVEGRYQDAGALPGHPATFRYVRAEDPGVPPAADVNVKQQKSCGAQEAWVGRNQSHTHLFLQLGKCAVQHVVGRCQPLQ